MSTDIAPGDHLFAAREASVRRMLCRHGIENEHIVFSDKFTKINRKDKHQERALIITNAALYNCKPSDLSKSKRRIPLERISAITISTVSDEFVVHVPSEYDYRLMGPRKSEAIEWLQTAREEATGAAMPLNQSSQVILRSVCLTRVEAEKRRTDNSTMMDNEDSEGTPYYQELRESALSTDALEPIVEESDEETDEDNSNASNGPSSTPTNTQSNTNQRSPSPPPPVPSTATTSGSATEAATTVDDFDAARERSLTVGWARRETRVTMNDFELVKVLGRGSFGKVIAARKVGGDDNGAVYAIKILNKKVLEEQDQIEHTQAEREILESISHPFLVGLKYAFQTPTKLYMVLPMYNGGELFTILKRERRFHEDRARFYAAEIALGLGHLHTNGITYRDLKPENLLLDTEGHIGLTDFGLSKRMADNEKSLTFCGTPEYLAPEIINDDGHDRNVDWWSYGILVYEMMAGRPPFYSSNQHKMYELITYGDLVFPDYFTEAARDFITKLLNRNPADRLGAVSDIEEIKAHPFFDSIEWDKLFNREIDPPFRPRVGDEEDFSNFDREFTSEPVVDSYAAPSALQDSGAFEGFTFVDRNSALRR